MRAIFAIALAGFTEARRNRVTVLIAVFALVMLLSTTIILNLAVFTLDRVATDFGLGVMSLLLVGLTIFLSSNQLSREIDRRTIFLVLSQPVSRAQFVFARTAGTVLTLLVLLVAMAGVFWVQMVSLRVPVTAAQFAAIGGLGAELVLLACLGAMLSSVSGPLVSSLCSVGLYLIGHGASDLYLIASRSKSEGFAAVGKALYWAVPQLDRLDYKLQAAYDSAIDWRQFTMSVAYALVYAAVAMTLAIVAFERADFK